MITHLEFIEALQVGLQFELMKKQSLYFQLGRVPGGKNYEIEKESHTSNLGVMNRDSEIKNDTLKTGSLIYIKE